MSISTNVNKCLMQGLIGDDAREPLLNPFEFVYCGFGKTVRYPRLFHIYGNDKKQKKVQQVSCGSQHTVAVCTDGQVFSWGNGANGRLGHGTTSTCERPTIIKALVVSFQERVVKVCAGDSHSMALNAEGRVFIWGSGSYGRLGLGSELNQYSPKLVEMLKEMSNIGMTLVMVIHQPR